MWAVSFTQDYIILRIPKARTNMGKWAVMPLHLIGINYEISYA